MTRLKTMPMAVTLAVAAQALAGCNTLRGVAIQSAFLGAAAANAREGAKCIRATEAGQRASAVGSFVLDQAGEVVNATALPLFPGVQADALGRIRVNRRGVCPPPPAPLPAPLPPAEPVAGPVTPEPTPPS